MRLNDELHCLEHHSRTLHLVLASLIAGREQLEALPGDARRAHLLALQQNAIEAVNESLSFSGASLRHVRTVGSFLAGMSVETLPQPQEEPVESMA